VGKKYSVTRERIRQIVEQVFCEIHECYTHYLQHGIDRILFTVHAKSGIIREEELLNVFPLDDWRERRAIVFLLEYMKGRFLKDEKRCLLDGVIATSNFDVDHFEKVVDTVYQVMDQRKSLMSLREIYGILTEIGIKKTVEELEAYLTVTPRIRRNVFDKWGIATWASVSPRGMRDRARLVLMHEGKPMHFREIAQKINVYGLNKGMSSANVQTVHNELIKDGSFVLVGRGIYALREWGFDDRTVRETIEQILKQQGGSLSREEIFDRVSKIKNVKKTTVFINLSHFFFRTGKNAYTLKNKE